jgi:4-diphosphocytidyl-2-C-methyl-D-erythritol kinase
VLESIRVDCNAKINLFLRILDQREDGYHNIETVFHSISLYDTLTLTKAGSGISVSCDDVRVPLDDTNPAVGAARSVLEGTDRGLNIKIRKRIPIGAGLGGGSADAAGVLVGANRLYGLGYAVSDLEHIGGEVGADVAFLVRGGCAVGRDRGERLERFPPLPALPLVLVVPPFSIRSGWAYRSYKMGLTRDRGRLTMVASALAGGRLASLFALLENDFESLVFEKHPSVRGIKGDFIKGGAGGALMTGSGPVVFGVFSKVGDAEACKGRFLDKGHDAILSRLANKGVTVYR